MYVRNINFFDKNNQTHLFGTSFEIEGLVKAKLKTQGLKEKEKDRSNIVAKCQAICKHEYMQIHKAITMKEWKESDVKDNVPQSKK